MLKITTFAGTEYLVIYAQFGENNGASVIWITKDSPLPVECIYRIEEVKDDKTRIKS